MSSADRFDGQTCCQVGPLLRWLCSKQVAVWGRMYGIFTGNLLRLGKEDV